MDDTYRRQPAASKWDSRQRHQGYITALYEDAGHEISFQSPRRLQEEIPAILPGVRCSLYDKMLS